MAQLAIRGHATRGREVIELLEMLGGINKYNLRGREDEWFVLNGTLIQRSDRLFAEKGFPLEQFLEKFPYKVGDKVTLDKFPCEIKGMSWEYDDIIYYVKGVDFSKGVYATDLQPYKEETMENKINEEMENLLEDISYNNKIVFNESLPDKTELVLENGYEVIVEDGKTYVVRKKPQYPKTYVECCKVLDIGDDFLIDIGVEEVICNFIRLKRCRDAYWKIAGEQMGLGKPWNQDYNDRCFIIVNNEGDIDTYEYHGSNNIIFAFPTEKMRDAFYENFKGLIEQCRELL